MWIVTDADGTSLASFTSETEAQEALLTGEHPDDAQIAYLND